MLERWNMKNKYLLNYIKESEKRVEESLRKIERYNKQIGEMIWKKYVQYVITNLNLGIIIKYIKLNQKRKDHLMLYVVQGYVQVSGIG